MKKKENMINTILFPSSYFNPKEVDEDLQQEYQAVLSTGLYDVILFDYDKWFNESLLKLSMRPEENRKIIYRGWMMKPESYELFYQKLLENHLELVTSPKEYETMHVFPNVYKNFGKDTAYMEIFPLNEVINVETLKPRFERFMIKDFVKSVKGTDFPKFFDRNVTQENFDRWMEVFYQYRGTLLTGGICIKEFYDLKKYGDHTNEYRIFYINHEIATISRNSSQPEYTPEVPKSLVEKYRNLPSKYYTVDYAELQDGTWKVIEAGDGSVSGLSENQNIEAYYRALYRCFN